MSTTISSFLDDIDQSIEENTLPPLPGATPSASPQPNGIPPATDNPFATMQHSIVTYLTALYQVTIVMQNIAHRHPEYRERIDDIMIPLINGIDATVDLTERMNQFLRQFATSQGLDNADHDDLPDHDEQDDTPDPSQPPDDPHDDQAWDRFFGHNQGGDNQ